MSRVTKLGWALVVIFILVVTFSVISSGRNNLHLAEKPEIIYVEGNPEPMQLRLFETPENWPIKFTTYIPQDFVAHTDESNLGFGARFNANYGDKMNSSVFMDLFLFKTEVTAEQALESIQGIIKRYKLKPVEKTGYAFATREYANTSNGTSVFLAFGEIDGQTLYLLHHFPVEYGDGFYPRVGVIFNRLTFSCE